MVSRNTAQPRTSNLQLTVSERIARRYKIEKNGIEQKSVSEQILDYMGDHSDVVTLKDIAAHFNYHPNYISSLLHRETGRKFTELLLEKAYHFSHYVTPTFIIVSTVFRAPDNTAAHHTNSHRSGICMLRSQPAGSDTGSRNTADPGAF